MLLDDILVLAAHELFQSFQIHPMDIFVGAFIAASNIAEPTVISAFESFTFLWVYKAVNDRHHNQEMSL